MEKKWNPIFTISPETAQNLMRIEAVKTAVISLPVSVSVLTALRETARLEAIHYSTVIEGNRLTLEQVEQVLDNDMHFPGRVRDEQEVKNYFTALDALQEWINLKRPVTEIFIQELHAMVMGKHSKTKKTLNPYRDGQNVIRDAATGGIIYLPPQAIDVPELMQQLCIWISEVKNVLPAPLIAALIHYQFATIHPYFDGNGRTARLLTTYFLHYAGYDLKGIYNLEEYYAQNLFDYYKALQVGPSHNYYEGRIEADLTDWVDYFIRGMTISFEKILVQTQEAINKVKKYEKHKTSFSFFPK